MGEYACTDFSIIVPTFREAKNIPELVKRIAALNVVPNTFELLLIDDQSDDGTDTITEELKQAFPWLKLCIRTGKRSLSESVLQGLQQAKFSQLIIMDADLSHPPEKIPDLLARLSDENVEMVVGSRYVSGGSTDEVWPFTRKLVSKSAAFFARLLIANRICDPLSGFFAIRKSTCFSGGELQPIGWKIGLEIMVKANCRSIKEIPIHFTQRKAGKSKLSLKVALNYLQHIKRLAFYKLVRFLNLTN